MTIYLSDLFDVAKFREMQDAGFVKIQRHPDFPSDLAIANYTAKAQQNYHWNEVTEQTRGLIFNPSTEVVLKRPFRKFYNYDESQADAIYGFEHVTAYDKMDGSLGIVYETPDAKLAVATRGSFTSDQAVWATNWLRASVGWAEVMAWDNGYLYSSLETDMFEIIYPENRIVVSYDFSGLVYLGSIQTDTGEYSMNDGVWAGRVAEPLYEGKFSELFKLPERQNAEGFVVVSSDGARRVKVKYEEYVKLHRIVTRLSERAIWEMMGGPYADKIEDLVSRIPEEHGNWARGVAEELCAQYYKVGYYLVELQMQLEGIKGADVRETRKLKALHIKDELPVVKACIFALLDGTRYDEILWKALRPKGDEDDKR